MTTRNNIRKMSKQDAARLGGLARKRLHGNFGTAEGRRKGGLRSLLTHKRRRTRFQQSKQIRIPAPSAALAELFGALAGDGHIGDYQVTLTTNSRTDREHATHIFRLFKKLFGVSATLTKRKGQNACVVTVSSKRVCDFLTKRGLVVGNKIKNNITMPVWISGNLTFRRAFVRGLFDTDGSVYVDTHKVRGKTYRNLGMLFSNRANGLLGAFKQSLEGLGLHPTQKTDFGVFLRREKEIKEYFQKVGSSNPKHLRKVSRFISC